MMKTIVLAAALVTLPLTQAFAVSGDGIIKLTNIPKNGGIYMVYPDPKHPDEEAYISLGNSGTKNVTPRQYRISYVIGEYSPDNVQCSVSKNIKSGKIYSISVTGNAKPCTVNVVKE